MAVETVNNIADLDPAYPQGAEYKSDGDDHIRNIKKALRQSFSGFEGAVICTGTNGGLVNSYTLTPVVAPAAYTENMLAVFTPTITNTGACVIDVAGLGAKAVTALDGSVLVAGDLTAGRTVMAVYKGSGFRLMSVTQGFVEQLVVGRTVPGVNVLANAGKFFSTDGTVGTWTDITPPQGEATFNKGNSGTTAQVINAAEGGGQTITATGAFNLSASGFPASRFEGVMVRIINGGAYSMTTSGITWIKFDGTKTTDFAQAGVTLQTTGETMFGLFSYGDGIIYGKGVV